ncbi:MAG TPA: tyrosine-type recombinase/integrase [Pyrinomonadaceae bacterium]|nr:tyrosine-type recombinase/integrase [Pyrinomonadaceae bacterium]
MLEWLAMSREEIKQNPSEVSQALLKAVQMVDLALLNAIHLWAAATTDAESACCEELLKAKRQAVSSFFAFAGKDPGEVSPLDVQNWRLQLEEQGFKTATIYARISRLSSFYEWAMKEPALSQFITNNPARLARPKCPRPYQTESTKALDDEKLGELFQVVRGKAQAGDIVGKRDYALLLFFITTGMRRQEVIGLRGSDVELKKDDMLVRCRVKGGDYVGRAINEILVREALLDYLSSCNRTNALGSNRPLWTRHDKAGKPGAPLSSHSFDKNLKRYARAAGIEKIHIHQTRHTFARIISEETGSIVETQDALGHKNVATTRVYVGRIAVKSDKHSRQIAARLKINP